ncbi:MAG: Ig-like domain-containing protein [Phycisphaerae bacterium]
MNTLDLPIAFRNLGWMPLVLGLVLAVAGFPSKLIAAAPVAASGSAQAEPCEAVTITLSATDADSDPLTYIISTLPTKGSLVVGSTTLAAANLPYTIPDAGKTVTYTATSTAHGTDTFTFKANDGTQDSTAATITVTVNRRPVAGTTQLTTPPNTDLNMTLPVSDPDNDTLSYIIVSLPGHARLKSGSTILTDADVPYAASSNKLTYSPDTDYHGLDTFEFTASDGYVTTGPIGIAIQVNTAPVPEDQRVTLLPDSSVTIRLIANDADRDPIKYTIASLPGHGTLSTDDVLIEEADLPKTLATGTNEVLYRVTPGYRGTDSFHFRVSDEVADSDRAVVTVAVNTPPLSPDSAVSGFSDTIITGILSPRDEDGDRVTLRLTALPETGVLKINDVIASLTATYAAATTGPPFTFSFTPDAGAVGTETFQWCANDGREDSIPGTVVLTILSVPVGGGTGDGSSDGGSSSGLSTGCGALGMGEVVFLAVGLLLVPSRTRRLPFSHL